MGLFEVTISSFIKRFVAVITHFAAFEQLPQPQVEAIVVAVVGQTASEVKLRHTQFCHKKVLIEISQLTVNLRNFFASFQGLFENHLIRKLT